MLRLTALIHTHNDALRLGRCLETVYPCDDIVVVDHSSSDGTVRLAREYGARVIAAIPGTHPQDYLQKGGNWILCLDPRESLTEGLAASLFEWKVGTTSADASAFCFSLRDETARGWMMHEELQTRVVPIGWQHWHEYLPANEPEARILEGELLRFAFP